VAVEANTVQRSERSATRADESVRGCVAFQSPRGRNCGVVAAVSRRWRCGEGVRMGSGGGGGGGVGSGRVLMTGGDRGCRQELSSGRDGGSWW
jgi:hypothetical protein